MSEKRSKASIFDINLSEIRDFFGTCWLFCSLHPPARQPCSRIMHMGCQKPAGARNADDSRAPGSLGKGGTGRQAEVVAENPRSALGKHASRQTRISADCISPAQRGWRFSYRGQRRDSTAENRALLQFFATTSANRPHACYCLPASIRADGQPCRNAELEGSPPETNDAAPGAHPHIITMTWQ